MDRFTAIKRLTVYCNQLVKLRSTVCFGMRLMHNAREHPWRPAVAVRENYTSKTCGQPLRPQFRFFFSLLLTTASHGRPWRGALGGGTPSCACGDSVAIVGSRGGRVGAIARPALVAGLHCVVGCACVFP